MTIHLKFVSRPYPRGFVTDLSMKDGSSAEELAAAILCLPEFSGQTEEIFKGLVIIRNGQIVPKATPLQEDDKIEMRKLMSGG